MSTSGTGGGAPATSALPARIIPSFEGRSCPTIRLAVASAAFAADWLGFTWHSLRHTFVIWQLDELDQPPSRVATLAGHESPEFTIARYVSRRQGRHQRLSSPSAGNVRTHDPSNWVRYVLIFTAVDRSSIGSVVHPGRLERQELGVLLHGPRRVSALGVRWQCHR